MADRLIGSLPAPGIPGCGATRVTRPGPLRLIPRPGPASDSTQRPVRTVRVKVAGAVRLGSPVAAARPSGRLGYVI